MIETKLISFLRSEISDDMRGHYLYIVRDKDVCFYVGRSENVINRLWQHFGMGTFKPQKSTLGEFVEANLPESTDFDIIFMRPSEVIEGSNTLAIPESFMMDIAEKKLIASLSPCLNVIYNLTPSELPERYIDPRIHVPNYEITPSDFIPMGD